MLGAGRAVQKVRAMRVYVIVLLLMATASAAESFLDRQMIFSDQRADKTRPGQLVVMLHNASSTARKFRAHTQFDAVARQRGLVVVYASATRAGWLADPAADIAYLSNMIEALRNDARVSPAPALVLGHSRGGHMAMRLACARPDLVAGIGVVASKAALSPPCTRPQPVGAVFIHGTADPIAPHDGQPGQTYSAADTVAQYAKRNRCSDETRTTRIDKNRSDGTSVVLRQFKRCAAPLAQALILGGGHGWPTGSGGSDGRLGPRSTEINAGGLIMQILGGRR